jgi:hypothetical protein
MSMTMHHNDDGVQTHDVDKNDIGIEIEIDENNAGMDDDNVLRPFVLPTLGEGISTMTTALGLECTTDHHPELLEDWVTTEWMSIVHEASTFSPNTSTSNSKERQRGVVVASTEEEEETVVGADTSAADVYLCVKDLTSFFVHNNNTNNDDDSNSNSSDISRHPLPAATTVTVTGDKDPEEDVSTATRATSSGAAAMQRRGNEYESMTTTADHHEFANFQHQFSSNNNLTDFGCPDVDVSSAERHHITSNDVETLPMFLPSPTSTAAVILRSS